MKYDEMGWDALVYNQIIQNDLTDYTWYLKIRQLIMSKMR